MAQQLTIPEIMGITKLARRSAQIPRHGLALPFIQCGRAPGTRSIFKSGESALLKSPYPVLNGSSAMSEEFCHLRARESLAHQQNAVETVVITRLLRPKYLLLYGNLHKIRIFDLEFPHGFLLSANSIAERDDMRNYL